MKFWWKASFGTKGKPLPLALSTQAGPDLGGVTGAVGGAEAAAPHFRRPIPKLLLLPPPPHPTLAPATSSSACQDMVGGRAPPPEPHPPAHLCLPGQQLKKKKYCPCSFFFSSSPAAPPHPVLDGPMWGEGASSRGLLACLHLPVPWIKKTKHCPLPLPPSLATAGLHRNLLSNPLSL